MPTADCTATQDLLLREPEGDLDAVTLARMEAHVVGCEACRQRRAVLQAVRVQLRATALAVPSPAPAEVWRELRPRLGDVSPAGERTWTWGEGARPRIWAGALAAVAAVALLAAFFGARPSAPSGEIASRPVPEARADYVQVTDNEATLVYVDQESGWLIVWASAPTPDAG